MSLQSKSILALSPAAGWTSAGLGGYAVLGGALTLLGWILDIPRLASWGLSDGDGIVTQPNTAMAALWTGAALIALSLGPFSAARLLAGGVALMGGMTLIEHLASVDLGIDRLLLFERSWGKLATTAPGRMGPPAATAYLLLGTGLLLGSGAVGSLNRAAAATLGLGVCAIGLLACTGYAFSADPLYDLARYTAIAPQTATLMLALGMGLVAAIPEREPMRVLLADSGAGALARRALPFLVLGPLLLGWLRLRAQEANLIDTTMGTALLVICLIAMLCGLLWRGVALLDQRESALSAAYRMSARADMLLRSARDQVIIFDRDWRCAYVNDRLSDLTGLSRDELLRRTLWQVWPDLAGTELERAARRAMELRQPEALEHRDTRSDRWYDARLSPVPDGNVALVALEITERKRAEQALKDSEQRFRLAAEAVRGIIYEVDFASGGNTERSQGLYEVLGYRVGDVPPTSRWWREQIHPDDRVATDERFIEAAASGRTVINTYRMRHRDGHWVHIEDRAVLLKDGAGTLLKMWGCAIDVTQQKEAQNRIYGLLDALQEADQKKDEFLATLAHELRNPLAPIRTSMEILNRAGDNLELAKRAHATMNRQVAQMVRLIDDLLDVSRIAHDKLELKKELVDLGEIVEHALDTCRPLVEAAHQDLIVRLPEQPVTLSADPARLAQILGNLLTNASKYTGAEGRIWLTVERQDDEVVMRVKDSGVGIAPSMLSRVFDMFTRLPDANGAPGGGLGIGLALVKRLVEMHEGQVTAHSEGSGRGSEFQVRLPILQNAEARETAPEALAPSAPARLRRILIVDDNRDAAESLAELLAVNGHTPQVVHDGIEAVAAAERFRPEIILLDIGLPGMDGYECCRAIRKEPWGRPLWIVGTTGWGQDEDRRKSKQAGFDTHLVKPVDPKALLHLMATLAPSRPDDA